jgi:hypothetical protein
MSQFVLVANGISSEDFEKAMEVKIRSGGKISFLPQQVQGQHGVTTQSMSSVKASPAALEVLNSVRFEWAHDGEEFGAEIVRVLAGHRHQHEEHQRREPAA